MLKPGGKIISVAGRPDPDFARDFSLNPILRLAIRLLSFRIRNRARRRGVSYSFLFVSASGDQLAAIASRIDSADISPVVDRVFPFDSTREALSYVATGCAKGKVVVKVR